MIEELVADEAHSRLEETDVTQLTLANVELALGALLPCALELDAHGLRTSTCLVVATGATSAGAAAAEVGAAGVELELLELAKDDGKLGDQTAIFFVREAR